MKKGLTTISLLLTLLSVTQAQSVRANDSLRHELSIATHDTTRMAVLIQIGRNLMFNRPDSAIYYANRGLILARKYNIPEKELDAMICITLSYINMGIESSALKVNLEARKLAEINSLTQKNLSIFAQSIIIYRLLNNYVEALNSSRTLIKLGDSTKSIFGSVVGRNSIALTFLGMNQIDSALFYGHLALDLAQKNTRYKTFPEYTLGKTYFEKGDYALALQYLHESLLSAANTWQTSNRLLMIAQVYHQMGVPDSSKYYGNIALTNALENGLYLEIIAANKLLSEIYETRDLEIALQYSKSAFAYRDTLDMLRKNATLEAFIDFDEHERQNEIEMATASYQNKVQRLWIFSIAGALISAIALALVLYRNNKNKQRANAKLKEQKEEIESTLEKLESTQTQLIHSEKMASLGELTAGIAHEIQNPLNFVNNFSEINKELLDELVEEIDKGNYDEVKALSSDIRSNEEKIAHHGKRADGIVKGMLQHSRTSPGVKEWSDINEIADEYLRLAYHGLRAKDKSFNADFRAELDETIPKIKVIPQDIGRVLLNMVNNAFFAVSVQARKGIPDYVPTVIISTRKLINAVEIRVKDNGAGIPTEVLDKIFQPFFTTKPTGEGTGLGLSLSYEIISKGHNGKLDVETREGIGTEFIIELPL